MAALKSRRARLASERGAELIEFALVLPILLLVVLGIVDFGFLFQRMEVVTNAAREGARMAVLPAYNMNTDVCPRIMTYLQNGGLATTGSCPNPTNPTISINAAYSVTLPSGASISGKQVVVEYMHSYVFIGPIMQLFGRGLGSVPVRGNAIMRDELSGSGS
jgi:hypothetical protein